MSTSFIASKLLSTKSFGVLAAVAAVVVSGSFVMDGSTAAFSGTSSNDATLKSGTVMLTNDHAAALFNATNLIPGYSETHCITLTSASSVPTTLQMYADTSADSPSALDSALVLSVVEGSGGTNTDGTPGGCAGFTQTGPMFNGTLTDFKAHNSYANGISGYNLPASGSRQFQITITLPSTEGNSVQGLTSKAKFVWENRS